MATSSRHRASRKRGGSELVASAGGAVLLVIIAMLASLLRGTGTTPRRAQHAKPPRVRWRTCNTTCRARTRR